MLINIFQDLLLRLTQTNCSGDGFCHDDEVMLLKCFQSMPSVVLSSKNVNDKIR